MSSKLEKQIQVELEQLSLALNRRPGVPEKARTQSLSPLKIDSPAIMLHCFYCGVENIFKRVAVHLDGGEPEGPNWHTLLLLSMTRPGKRRPAVISEEPARTLKGYLDFRHAYSFELQ